MSSEKQRGTVRWFSNRKGYGFITPTSENRSSDEEIFVHHSAIYAKNYKTLMEGWEVEFDVVKEESGKIKAENVTAPGGGYCTGPKSRRRKKPAAEEQEGQSKQASASTPPSTTAPAAPPVPYWHESLVQDVRDSILSKGVSTFATGTVDVAIDQARIKLGQGGYTSLARADGVLAEGSFECAESGEMTLSWEKALEWDDSNSEWKLAGSDTPTFASLVTKFNLGDDIIKPVGKDETPEKLWGEGKTNPKKTLEATGFKMRKVTLTVPPKRASRPPPPSS